MRQNPSSLNLADVMEVLHKQWKMIAAFVTIVLIITAALLFFVLPKYYKSVAVVIAANPELADKAHLFNNNIESLYSTFGNEEDLDRIRGIADLDTTLKLLVDEFNLADYYKVKGNSNQKRHDAILKLRDDITIQKTELYQLRVIVYTKNNELSANIANRLIEIVENMAENIWLSSYKKTLDEINQSKQQLEKQVLSMSDSLKRLNPSSGAAMVMTGNRSSLLEQLQQYEKTASEYKLAINNKTPALIVLEKAYPSAAADKPDKLIVLVIAFFSSFLFALIACLVYEQKEVEG
jgi:uncharacterized protein involved in exopolysaccharide biosynthesis